jgi:hypothetical protein
MIHLLTQQKAKKDTKIFDADKESQRTLLKARFMKEGRLISQWNMDGIRQDGYVFGKVNPELITR